MKPNKYHNIWCVAMRKTAKMKKPERVVFRLTPRKDRLEVHVMIHGGNGSPGPCLKILNLRQAKQTLQTVRDKSLKPVKALYQKSLDATWERKVNIPQKAFSHFYRNTNPKAFVK